MLAPASKAALLKDPSGAHLAFSEELNGQNLFSGSGLTCSGGSALAALPIFLNVTLRAKNRNIFCPNRIEVKILQSYRKCGTGDS